MTEPASAPRHNCDDSASRLDRLSSLVGIGHAELRRDVPDKEDLYYCLFLGQHYAAPEPGIRMLGLNPGLSDHHKPNTELQSTNWLLEKGPTRHSYWRNARKFFETTPALRSQMEWATYSFCCPFRTRSWKLPVAHRRALMAASRPILQQMLNDCAPRFVILAGVETEQVFQQTAGVDLSRQGVRPGPFREGTYRSSATDATWRGRPLVICQVPHFSRANNRTKLEKCGQWLSEVLAQ